MRYLPFWLPVLLLASCLESNPQPSPERWGEEIGREPVGLDTRGGRRELAPGAEDAARQHAEDVPLPEVSASDQTVEGDLPVPWDLTGDTSADLLIDLLPDLLSDLGLDLPQDGFGTISGECGVLDEEELLSDAPWLVVNAIDFGDDPYDEADFPLLTPGGQKVIEDDNAGGSSLLSEAFAYEILHRCESAELLKTEMEIDYVDPQGKKTDLLVVIDGEKMGVSVTRAVGWPKEDPYTAKQAQELLDKKLQGILDSSANVSKEDAWSRQILYVLAYGPAHADSVAGAFAAADPAMLADTIVFVTTTNGDDEFLY